jgi:hypothetical protein
MRLASPLRNDGGRIAWGLCPHCDEPAAMAALLFNGERG